MMERRAVAIRVYGDPEIGGALGMALGRGTTSSVAALCAAPPSPEGEGKEGRPGTSFDPATGRATFPKGEGQKSADAGAVAVIDRARMEAMAVADKWIEGERLKRAVGNYKTPEEYEALIEDAREQYGRVRINPISCAVLAVIGLLVLMATEFLAWEERQWRA